MDADKLPDEFDAVILGTGKTILIMRLLVCACYSDAPFYVSVANCMQKM